MTPNGTVSSLQPARKQKALITGGAGFIGSHLSELLLADREKAKRLLAWEPEITFEEGLRRTIDWLSGSLDAYKPSLYNV